MKHVKLSVGVLTGWVLCIGPMARSDESLDRIVTVRATDGLIQIVDANGRVERSFGGSVTRNAQGATAQAPNFRVAVGDVLEVGAPQILTAVADQLDPCRRLFDPDGGKAIDLRWSREGRYALDVAASRSGALTINEKRHAEGRPVSSYWNCYNVGANERLFHSEFRVSLLRAANGDLLLAYYDRTPDMPAKGMVMRRSPDDGKTWSERVVITPRNGSRHAANNACLTRLSSGRIVLATRE